MSIKPLEGKAKRSMKASTARFNIWEGAVRSGKTIVSIIRWMRYVLKGPAGNLAMIGKTERTLKRNVIDPIIELVGTKRARYLVGAGEFWLFGRRIYVCGANDVKAVDKLRGLTLAGAYGDEISTWPEEMWDMLGTRLSVAGAQVFGTCNPEGPMHWLKAKWLNRAALWIDHEGDEHVGKGETLDLHRYSFTLEDNPHNPPEFVKSLKAQYTGVFYRRNILGMWVPAEGAIYDMWDPEKHVVRGPRPEITRWISLGIDFGTTAAAAAMMLGVGRDRRLHLTHEWGWDSVKRQQRLTSSEYAASLKRWTREDLKIEPEWWCVDPSAAGFREDLLRLNIVSAAADNAVTDGLRLMTSLFTARMIDVHESCEGFIEEAPAYTWDPKAQLLGEDKPIKERDHYLDGGRYGVKTPEVIWRGEVRGGYDLAA